MEQEKQQDATIAIVGGGLGGLTLAYALLRAGHRPHLIDPNANALLAQTDGVSEGEDGRAYALSLASMRLYRALGGWEAVAPFAEPIRAIKVGDGAPGEGVTSAVVAFDHDMIEAPAMGYMVPDGALRAALRAGVGSFVQEGRLALHAARLHQIDWQPRPRLHLEGGAELAADLVIAADGRQSKVAASAGLARIVRDYRQSGVVCTLRHALPHRSTAYQIFMREGPLGILPLPGGHESSIVWSVARETATRLMALDDAEFLDAIRPAFGAFLGKISLKGRRYSYPLSLSMTYETIAPNLALIGDAAHGIHPLAGQGLNLGLKDIAVLVEVLSAAAQRGEALGAVQVLERYQRWRRLDTASVALATDLLNGLFSTDQPVARGVRRLGLRLAAQSPALRKRMVRQAAGLSGDLPRLMQGLPAQLAP